MKELKYLNKYLSKYKRYLLLGTLFVIISNIFQIIPAQLVRYSIDLVVENIRMYRSFDGLSLQKNFFSVFAFGILLYAGLILVMALLPNVALAQEAQPKLPQINLRAGMHIVKAEVADNVGTRSTGMMFRKEMAQHEGMLFVFEHKQAHCFWMRNTVLPLSIAFIADDGSIVNTAEMKPLDESSHCAQKPVRFALEMNKGWFTAKNLKAGSRFEGLPAFKQ